MSTFVLLRFRSWQAQAKISIMEAKRVRLGATGDTVRANIASARNEQRLTLRELAERTAEIGRPMSNSTISQIENGSRRVDVDDLLTLSIALDIAPVALLVPKGDDASTVSATGIEAVSVRDLRNFVEGYRSLRGSGLDFVLRSLSLGKWQLMNSRMQSEGTGSELEFQRVVQTDGSTVHRGTMIGTELPPVMDEGSGMPLHFDIDRQLAGESDGDD
ncbi:helix-turn-helix transcriptional regulator [Rhodococcus yunnanensis]|nr:helix-turn-helix transcriptional regulator [Rhodococcus yunnanensis]